MAQVVHTAKPFHALLSKRGTDLPGPRIGDPRKSAELISFYAGFPDPASLPAEEVAAATTRALARDGQWALQYGSPTGYSGLIDVLLAKLERDQGIGAKRENILITAGGSQVMQLVLDAFVDWGDTVITEAPTWMGAVRAFKNVGAQVVSIPVDTGGTDVAALEQELNRLRDERAQP
ncbi:MAG: aminotransferase class I/II-fold pyridoxal phosphate-dependent enzyme, partial [Chloroflexota bacterium]|nr:aminotransferase class I/II-fold pyridoxal phosphate-dependent enzyme [Chloroflexota bacterium]